MILTLPIERGNFEADAHVEAWFHGGSRETLTSPPDPAYIELGDAWLPYTGVEVTLKKAEVELAEQMAWDDATEWEVD